MTRLVLLSLLICSRAFAESDTLLITAFDPFGGNPQNHSQPVAHAVADELRASHPELNVEICILPVVYDQAARAALECLRRLPEPPKWMVSFGEGQCEIHLETRARNWDGTPGFPDNAREIRTGQEIIKGAPEFVKLGLPVEQMYSSLDSADSWRVRVSKDMGAFVCNNTAYRVMTELQGSSSSVRYGFIHVPPASCGSAVSDARVNGRIIGQMLGRVI